MKKYSIYLLIPILFIIPISLYFGSYLPWKKAQNVINAMRNGQAARSLDAFKAAYAPLLNSRSPVGEDEALKQLITMSFGAVSDPNAPKEVVEELVKFVASYVEPAVAKGSGAGFVQYHYVMGSLYARMGLQHKDVAYLEKAERLFKDGLVLSPTRPQFYYGLFDIYNQGGRQKDAEVIAQKILEYWPKGFDIQ